MLALTAGVSAWMERAVRARDLDWFRNAVESSEDRIHNRLANYVLVLYGARGLLAADHDVTSAEFHAYAEQLELQRRYPGIQGIGFAKRIPPGQAGALVQERLRDGLTGFRVWPDPAGGESHAIVFLEPLDRRNRAALGYDMSSEAERRRAMERARDTGEPAATGRVTLVQEIDAKKQSGFLIYLAVYAGGRTPETVAERRDRLLGFVYSPFRTGDLFRGIFGTETRPRIAFEVHDSPSTGTTSLMYASTPRGDPPGYRPRHVARRTLEIAGRPWTVDFRTRPAFDSTPSASLLWLVPITGLLLGGMLFVLLRVQVRAREEAERSEARLRFLARATGAIQRSLDPRSMLVAVAAEAVPRLGERCLADLVGPEGTLEPVADARAPGGALEVAPDPAPAGMRPRPGEAMARILDGGRAAVVLAADALRGREDDAPGGATARPEGAEWALVAPLVARGATLGVLTFLSPRPATASDLGLAEELASRAGLALDNARLYQDAQEANRRKDRFLAMLGHELRNPLAAIQYALRLLGRASDGDGGARGVIARQARQLARLVDDLLDVSRIDAGKITLRLSTVDLREVALSSWEAHRPTWESRGQRGAARVPDEPVWVEGDPARLEQVVSNLLDNAIKYTPPGGRIALDVSRAGTCAVLAVEDDGIGIAPEMLPRIFELFTQEERSVGRTQGGLGLGLALVRELVRMHGGEVVASSPGPDRGSRFEVRVPLAAPGGVRPAPEGIPARPARRRILIVEDQDDVRETLREVLEMEGHTVATAVDGPGGVDGARAFRPDVALVDIGLPGFDGLEVARRIRSGPVGRTCVLLALTGYGQPADRERALAAGFDGHLVKPVDPDALGEWIAGAGHSPEPGRHVAGPRAF
ncbi:CHASE domain-containing protein [Myxococcota bacterium]|nr:CHASE domain-containing protein [Myxococcota bacterium]